MEMEKVFAFSSFSMPTSSSSGALFLVLLVSSLLLVLLPRRHLDPPRTPPSFTHFLPPIVPTRIPTSCRLLINCGPCLKETKPSCGPAPDLSLCRWCGPLRNAARDVRANESVGGVADVVYEVMVAEDEYIRQAREEEYELLEGGGGWVVVTLGARVWEEEDGENGAKDGRGDKVGLGSIMSLRLDEGNGKEKGVERKDAGANANVMDVNGGTARVASDTRSCHRVITAATTCLPYKRLLSLCAPCEVTAAAAKHRFGDGPCAVAFTFTFSIFFFLFIAPSLPATPCTAQSVPCCRCEYESPENGEDSNLDDIPLTTFLPYPTVIAAAGEE
ncbi:hypothetical protein R3P38DRAFT_3244984 [Favolaschia claudopus]|uniref:Uncharacterized protein n=1 Tax=Favolaschia claudopus TaxID=2862362 RepID=A0AAV9Z155_9AGAR